MSRFTSTLVCLIVNFYLQEKMSRSDQLESQKQQLLEELFRIRRDMSWQEEVLKVGGRRRVRLTSSLFAWKLPRMVRGFEQTGICMTACSSQY